MSHGINNHGADPARAVLHYIDEADFPVGEPILIINDFHRTLSSRFPDAARWEPETSLQMPEGEFGCVILLAPKQKDETRYLIAKGIGSLSKGGRFIVAAANDAGGKALKNIMAKFGVKASDHIKHKCRVAVAVIETRESAELEKARQAGELQQRSDGLWSRPGLFSWDETDTGTDMLLHHLPLSLKGRGADFGCGIGVIGVKLLERYEGITGLINIDRDSRALQACEKNLMQFSLRTEFLCADLTGEIKLQPLEFIVMNPPFHNGKEQSAAIGQAFIRNAATALKKDGLLVFVANSYLPYEKILKEEFSFSRILHEEHGFKIIEAVK